METMWLWMPLANVLIKYYVFLNYFVVSWFFFATCLRIFSKVVMHLL